MGGGLGLMGLTAMGAVVCSILVAILGACIGLVAVCGLGFFFNRLCSGFLSGQGLFGLMHQAARIKKQWHDQHGRQGRDEQQFE